MEIVARAALWWVAVLLLTREVVLASGASSAVVVHTYTGLKERYFPDFHSRYRNFTFSSRGGSEDADAGSINISIEQFYRRDGAGVGSAVWEGATVLSHFLAGSGGARVLGVGFNKSINVLEVGAGQGLVSITAGILLARRHQSAKIIVTDGDPNVLNQTTTNIQRNIANASSVNISAQLMKWDNVRDMSTVRHQFDETTPLIILAADVVFELKPSNKSNSIVPSRNQNEQIHAPNHAFRALASTFDHFCSQTEHCLVLLAYKMRRARESQFFNDMRRKGFVRKKLKQRFLRPRSLRGVFQIFAFAQHESAIKVLDAGRRQLFESVNSAAKHVDL